MGGRRPLAHLSVGDRIVGHGAAGSTTAATSPPTVLAHWSTIKPAYRVTLEDGTELVASGDHRFLTNRGWKFVTGRCGGPEQRPHLTTNNELLGTGRLRLAAGVPSDYRRGYLCAASIRGDGHIGSYSYSRPGRARDEHHRFRLALCDDEALDSARRLSAGRRDVARDAFASTEATATTAAHGRSARQRRASVERDQAAGRRGRCRRPTTGEGASWPGSSTRKARAGAGAADREYRPLILRLDRGVPRGTSASITCEEPRRHAGLTCVRVRGGLRERLRFFHLTDPAITRKRTVAGDGAEVRREDARREHRAARRAMRLYDITTGTGDFIANGVVSHNCFARPTHTYLDFNAGRDFEREIVVKVNAPEVLRAELARPSWKGEHIALGTNTDPYQWVEGRYKLMRGIWEALRDAAQPVLGPDQVAAAAARSGSDAGDRRGHGLQREPLGARRSTRRRGGRASRTRRNPRARLEAVARAQPGRASRPASWSRR